VGADWGFHESHFSPARVATYLTQCQGDQDRAAALYRWNSEVGAAFWVSLGHLEVSLRNALDGQMTRRQLRLGLTGHWVFDGSGQLGKDAGGPGRHTQPYLDVATAIRRVRANNKPVSPDQVISELPFGFWHQLVARRQQFLWPDLASAFPHLSGRSPLPVRERVARLRTLRNRIGHHHSVWSLDLAGRHADLLDLADYIDTDLNEWIDTYSTVATMLAVRP
jgi:hypothetical protein